MVRGWVTPVGTCSEGAAKLIMTSKRVCSTSVPPLGPSSSSSLEEAGPGPRSSKVRMDFVWGSAESLEGALDLPGWEPTLWRYWELEDLGMISP